FTNFASSGGDANGFKAGGYGKNGDTLPNPVPRHVVRFCLAVKNRANGFYANHHAGGDDWFDNTAFRNGVNFNMLCVSNDNLTDVPGYDHVMKNNLGFLGNREVTNLGDSNDVSFNYFTLPVIVASNDFVSLDESLLTLPRKANGDLPDIAFAQLARSSDLVNCGTNIGAAFSGVAPDLGAFERGLNPPAISVSRIGTNLVFSGSGGAARGPFSIIATTNLALSPAQWILVASNTFDFSGNFMVANPLANDSGPRFFRIQLP
ncbi:MAG TPA: hypothetical protein VFM25_15210, partial [Verrucomicrobiae bacterium]|nr:hypothetical protein [Verrucomicrobiae bacterium]